MRVYQFRHSRAEQAIYRLLPLRPSPPLPSARLPAFAKVPYLAAIV